MQNKKGSMKMFRQLIEFTSRYKVVRGMLSYGTLWPCGCLIEQTIIEKRTYHDYDWMKCLRFSLFGALFMGPTIYVWIRLAGIMWPRTDIRSSLCKALTEQVAYDPFAISSFLFFMNLMDGGSFQQAKKEDDAPRQSEEQPKSSSDETVEDMNETRRKRSVELSSGENYKKDIEGNSIEKAGIPGLPDPTTILKIAEILKTLGEKVVPILVEGNSVASLVTERVDKDYVFLKDFKKQIDNFTGEFKSRKK
ncbi:uncharacterized protein plh isoform X2 [Eurosta solidaginis]|uniref:uncharacterized protein plh isoform X2 n=1 Tax=Eurosta solidaginis TaxID=178769 RepID=UPI003530A5CB